MRRAFNEKIAASGTNTLTIDWEVPDTIPFVGFRVKAATGNFGDGEQVMIPVLQAISPVIETQPFYIDAATPSFTTKLPQFAKDARVTLEYCDNPVWYCVQALPTIFNDNYKVATSLAHSLFAVTLAQGIAKSQPNIKEAVDYWKANEQDSTLVSMLARNSDLKIGTLLASPWVREADRQTLRMSRLNELFDEQLMAAEHKRIVEGLQQIPGVDYDKNRLEQELIYYIEKLDISEEKQRLTNHLKYFRETMAEPAGQGKKLGFIAQEMGREINTTGSKSNQAEMQNIVVKMKDELEQIKEQVLNAL